MTSDPIITFSKYERARMIGSRALQLSMGAPLLLKLSDDELKNINFSPIEIAKKEFSENVIPITVRRPLPEHLAAREKKKGKDAS